LPSRLKVRLRVFRAAGLRALLKALLNSKASVLPPTEWVVLSRLTVSRLPE
jgi:hypothetical protein